MRISASASYASRISLVGVIADGGIIAISEVAVENRVEVAAKSRTIAAIFL
ncbi:hypothetical protein O4H52_13940 [Sphingomonadaceae bacterium G21617-S1]|nr:hypothetical protein [Sphingomonadaceae bacterium G21617-S1]